MRALVMIAGQKKLVCGPKPNLPERSTIQVFFGEH
jgi:hypothetical protein